MTSSLLFRGSRLHDRPCDLRVREGRIEALRYLDQPGVPRLDPLPGEEQVEGGLLTPPLAEPHVHLDAALLGAQAPNHSGTLREGIRNWSALRPGLTEQDLRERALCTAQMYAGWGCQRIRTHVDTGSRLAVETLLGLKGELARRGIELQVVAFPQEGILRGPGRRQAWQEAVALGCDAVGAIPHFERTAEEGRESLRLCFDLALAQDIAVDLHCDETDDPGSRHLELACALTLDRGWGDRVIAGHCTALHSYDNSYAAKVVELVAESGLLVVCNPLDNVVLQGRHDSYPRRRGLTRVDQLWAAGARVAFGHDSVQDPWYRLGTANLVDAAYMAVHVAQLTSEDEMRRTVRALWGENHAPWGGPPPIEEGAAARLLWWDVADEIEILRDRPRPRVISP